MSRAFLRPLLITTALAVTSLGLSNAVTAQQGKVLLKVDDMTITEDDVKTAMDDVGPSLPKMTDPQRQQYLSEYLLDLKLLAREAAKRKLGDTPEFARKLGYLKDRTLMEGLMASAAEGAATPEKMKTFFDEATKGMPPEEEARARHILVEKEEDAKKIVTRLKAGEDFAKLAAELSKDPGSGKEGGDLGFFTRDRMVPEFSNAAFGLKPGEVSAPVKSDFGWHVIKLEELRTKPLPKLEDVKDELTRYLNQKAQQELIMKLRGEAKIERLNAPKPEADAKPADAKPVEAKPAEPNK